MSGSEGRKGVRVVCPVRWGDMDALAHVNNTVYFQFCETARIAYFEAVDLDAFKTRPTDGPGLVAASLSFRRQMRYPGAVAVEANVTRIGARSFTIGYVLKDAADEGVVADGDSVCVWVDYEAGKAMELPRGLVEAIARIEDDPALAG